MGDKLEKPSTISEAPIPDELLGISRPSLKYILFDELESLSFHAESLRELYLDNNISLFVSHWDDGSVSIPFNSTWWDNIIYYKPHIKALLETQKIIIERKDKEEAIHQLSKKREYENEEEVSSEVPNPSKKAKV